MWCNHSTALIYVQAATALLGPDVLLVATAIFCKYGPRPDYIAPHHAGRCALLGAYTTGGPCHTRG